MRDRPSFALGAVLVGSLAAVVIALVHQHAFEMLPCAWCVLQRLIYLVIATASAVALGVRLRWLRTGLAGGIVLLAGSGVAAAWYQHVVAADTSSCRLSLAQRIIGSLELDALWPPVFGIQVGCAAGATNWLGIPYEFWSLAAFASLAVLASFAAHASVAAVATRRSRITNVR